MHTLVAQTKFTFGDRVRFDSEVQKCNGTGEILAITVEVDGSVNYLISVPDAEYLYAGILEDEITLLGMDE
ncbi:hypothetical protein [Gemmata sp.]|uniref:hypothetical protein n=1 Tax=Gemmata sp. TaxID=1914242 RepID=UPI003F7171CB